MKNSGLIGGGGAATGQPPPGYGVVRPNKFGVAGVLGVFAVSVYFYSIYAVQKSAMDEDRSSAERLDRLAAAEAARQREERAASEKAAAEAGVKKPWYRFGR